MNVTLRGVVKIYKDKARTVKALDRVDLEVGAGEFVAIMGKSGSGKTTLLNVVGGLDSDYSGLVLVGGRDLKKLGDYELSLMRNRVIGFVFQAFHLLPHLTVAENIVLPAFFCKGVDQAEIARRVEWALDKVGLLDKAGVSPVRLSAGERQRVAIARAIFNRPTILLCDEPTGNLDEITGQSIIEIFSELNKSEKTTIIVATHSERVAKAASRNVVLDAGRIVSDLRMGR